MASNHTPNYNLNQWQATDQVKRTDFNEDNAKIDAALAQARDHAGMHLIQEATIQSGRTAIDFYIDVRGFDWSQYSIVCVDYEIVCEEWAKILVVTWTNGSNVTGWLRSSGTSTSTQRSLGRAQLFLCPMFQKDLRTRFLCAGLEPVEENSWSPLMLQARSRNSTSKSTETNPLESNWWKAPPSVCGA